MNICWDLFSEKKKKKSVNMLGDKCLVPRQQNTWHEPPSKWILVKQVCVADQMKTWTLSVYPGHGPGSQAGWSRERSELRGPDTWPSLPIWMDPSSSWALHAEWSSQPCHQGPSASRLLPLRVRQWGRHYKGWFSFCAMTIFFIGGLYFEKCSNLIDSFLTSCTMKVGFLSVLWKSSL